MRKKPRGTKPRKLSSEEKQRQAEWDGYRDEYLSGELHNGMLAQQKRQPKTLQKLLAHLSYWRPKVAEFADDSDKLWIWSAESIVREIWRSMRMLNLPDVPDEPNDLGTALEIMRAMDTAASWLWRAWRNGLPALSPVASAVYDILRDLPEHAAKTEPEILLALASKDARLRVDSIRGRIKRELEPYGIENFPRIGYRIKADFRHR
jgi:hypothetical protein